MEKREITLLTMRCREVGMFAVMTDEWNDGFCVPPKNLENSLRRRPVVLTKTAESV